MYAVLGPAAVGEFPDAATNGLFRERIDRAGWHRHEGVRHHAPRSDEQFHGLTRPRHAFEFQGRDRRVIAWSTWIDEGVMRLYRGLETRPDAVISRKK
jgi:hypothetical protein